MSEPAPPAAGRGQGLPPELRAGLRDLLRALASTRVTELELSRGGARLHLRRRPRPDADLPAAPLSEAEPRPAESGLATIRAGLVGTFYRAPRAGGEPLSGVGAQVAVGQALGVIETLELVNEVVAPVAGTVRALLVEDGASVEYGQPLIVIEPEPA